MKQLVILSGKGGTGKTSITGALAHLASLNGYGGKFTMVDADVDASNLELLLNPARIETNEFIGGKIAVIDQDTCAACGICESVCRFDAISERDGEYFVDPFACEGCAACFHQCNMGAIEMVEQKAGELYVSNTEYGRLYHAHLFPGQENSGKLVSLVRQQAQYYSAGEQHRLILVDGPPGIGCPVISAVTGADLALIVTEPTASGELDMIRVLKTAEHFGVQTMVCINKADISTDSADIIERYCLEHNITIAGKIPYDLSVIDAVVNRKPITEHQPDSKAAQAVRELWQILSIEFEEEEVQITWK